MQLAQIPLPELHHDSLVSSGESVTKSYTSRFFSLDGGKNLHTILQDPYDMLIEAGNTAAEPIIASLTVDAPDFALSITTESAYSNDVSAAVTHALCNAFSLSNRLTIPVKTCLHEALSNAIVHGNLGLESHHFSMKDFESYYAAIEQRIGSAPYNDRRISITAWNRNHYMELKVSDEGQGFIIETGAPDDAIPHGRGLYLIRSLTSYMWLGEDRRTLCMRFGR